jgi:hypothetical protein
MTPHDLLPREIQVPGVLILVAFMGWLVYLVRTQRVSLRDSLVWILSTVAALALTLFPQLLVGAAHALNVQIPSNALFGAAIIYLSFNLLSVTVASSMNAASVRRLAQECALLRGEIEALRRQGAPHGRTPTLELPEMAPPRAPS